MRIPVLLVLVLAQPIGAATAAQLQPQGRIRWLTTVAYADRLRPEPTVFRFYDAQDAIVVRLTISNRSASSLVLNQAALESATTISVTGTADTIPIETTWDTEVWESRSDRKTLITRDTEIRIAPDQGAEWTLRLRMIGGQPFQTGRYDVTMSPRKALLAARTDSGVPWAGRAVTSTTLHLVIADPVTPAERASRFRLAGQRARDENRLDDAVRELETAVRSDATNVVSMLELSQVFFQLKRHRDAVPYLERALSVQGNSPHSAVPFLLARAYVATNDRPKAIQVLRSAGLSDSRIESALARIAAVLKGPR
jgi:hypothetical protein